MRWQDRGPLPEIEVRVRCSDQIHRIRRTNTGRIRLEDHTRTEAKAEEALAALGGEPCTCVQVLQAWRNATRDLNELKRLPAQLADARKHTVRIGLRRHTEVALLQSRDKLRLGLQVRLEERLERLVLAVIDGAMCYGFSSDSTVVQVGPASSIKVRYNLLVVQVPLRWVRLYRMGAAQVDGNLVIDLLQERPDGSLLVLAGRQGRVPTNTRKRRSQRVFGGSYAS